LTYDQVKNALRLLDDVHDEAKKISKGDARMTEVRAIVAALKEFVSAADGLRKAHEATMADVERHAKAIIYCVEAVK
jgi:hypothetical protein